MKLITSSTLLEMQTEEKYNQPTTALENPQYYTLMLQTSE